MRIKQVLLQTPFIRLNFTSISFFLLLLFTSTPLSSLRSSVAQTKEELGAIFHDGNILKPFLGVPRLTKKRFPYGNSTADSLNQFREEIRNGNDFNLVGDNVGEGTIFSDDVENISTAYARHFTSARLSTSQGSISMGRFDVSTVKIGSDIIIAGGVTKGDSGKAQRQVDIWTSVRDIVLAAIPTPFAKDVNTIIVNVLPTGMAVPSDADKKLKIEGIGIPYDTYVTAIAGTTLTISRQTNGINDGTQIRFYTLPDTPVEETGSWTYSGEALSVARQGMGACSSTTDQIALFGGGFAIETGNVEVTLYDTVDIYKNGVWSTSSFPEKSWSAALPANTALAFKDRSHRRYDASAAYLNGKAYFAGGVSGVPADVTVMFERRVDVYDVATETWSLLQGPPINQNLKCLANTDYYCPEGMYTARANFAMIACDLPSSGLSAGNDLLFFAGGTAAGKYYRLAEPTEYLTQVDIFDVTANQWLPVTHFPSGIGRSNLAAEYFDGKVYFAGGATATRFTDAVDIYNPQSNTWVVYPPVCCGAHNYESVSNCKTSFADPRCETQRLSQMRANPFMTILEYRPNINYKPNKAAMIIDGSVVANNNVPCTSGVLCVKQFDEMLVVVGGLTGGSSSRWFFEARGMASPRIDFIKGAFSYWQDLQGTSRAVYDNNGLFTGIYQSLDASLVGVPGEVRTQYFMHDVASRGMMDGAAMAANGKLLITTGLTTLYLPSLRVEVVKWKRPYICTSIARDNDMCAFADMERIQPSWVPPKTPTCDYQFLPNFKPWFCPCPSIRAVPDLQRNPINFDFECATGGKATWPVNSGDYIDNTKCRTSPMCFTKCLINSETLAAKVHSGHQRGWDDCPGLWERPFDDDDKAYMLKNDVTVPYFGIHKFDDFGERVTFGQIQTRYRDVYTCPRDCFPCGERASAGYPGYPFEGTCVKPKKTESGCVGNARTLRNPIHPLLSRVKCEDVVAKGVSASALY